MKTDMDFLDKFEFDPMADLIKNKRRKLDE